MSQARPTIIGFSGKMRSGKSYAAKMLCKRFGFAPVSFASALKEDIVDMGFDPEDVYVNKPPIVRRLMQTYGQAKRWKSPNYWITRANEQVQALQLLYPGTVIVFDDVRFPNEVDYIHQQGGVVIRLERVPQSLVVECPGNPIDQDESETALDGVMLDDFVVARDGELDLLEAGVVRALQRLGVF